MPVTTSMKNQPKSIAGKKRVFLDESDDEVNVVSAKKVKVQPFDENATIEKIAEKVADMFGERADAQTKKFEEVVGTQLNGFIEKLNEVNSANREKIDEAIDLVKTVSKDLDGMKLSVAGEGLLQAEKHNEAHAKMDRITAALNDLTTTVSSQLTRNKETIERANADLASIRTSLTIDLASIRTSLDCLQPTLGDIEHRLVESVKKNIQKLGDFVADVCRRN